MNLNPSHKTAALAGAWSAFCLSPFEMWMESHGPFTVGTSNMLWALALAVFFVLPAYFFVLGKHDFFQPNWFMNPDERARYGAIARRMGVWLVSTGVIGAVWSGVLSHVFG